MSGFYLLFRVYQRQSLQLFYSGRRKICVRSQSGVLIVYSDLANAGNRFLRFEVKIMTTFYIFFKKNKHCPLRTLTLTQHGHWCFIPSKAMTYGLSPFSPASFFPLSLLMTKRSLRVWAVGQGQSLHCWSLSINVKTGMKLAPLYRNRNHINGLRVTRIMGLRVNVISSFQLISMGHFTRMEIFIHNLL